MRTNHSTNYSTNYSTIDALAARGLWLHWLHAVSGFLPVAFAAQSDLLCSLLKQI
jgi:hypothetical protein